MNDVFCWLLFVCYFFRGIFVLRVFSHTLVGRVSSLVTLKTVESARGNDLCLIPINLVPWRRGSQVRGKSWERVWIQIIASKSDNADTGTIRRCLIVHVGSIKSTRSIDNWRECGSPSARSRNHPNNFIIRKLFFICWMVSTFLNNSDNFINMRSTSGFTVLIRITVSLISSCMQSYWTRVVTNIIARKMANNSKANSSDSSENDSSAEEACWIYNRALYIFCVDKDVVINWKLACYYSYLVLFLPQRLHAPLSMLNELPLIVWYAHAGNWCFEHPSIYVPPEWTFCVP